MFVYGGKELSTFAHKAYLSISEGVRIISRSPRSRLSFPWWPKCHFVTFAKAVVYLINFDLQELLEIQIILCRIRSKALALIRAQDILASFHREYAAFVLNTNKSPSDDEVNANGRAGKLNKGSGKDVYFISTKVL